MNQHFSVPISRDLPQCPLWPNSNDYLSDSDSETQLSLVFLCTSDYCQLKEFSTSNNPDDQFMIRFRQPLLRQEP